MLPIATCFQKHPHKNNIDTDTGYHTFCKPRKKDRQSKAEVRCSKSFPVKAGSIILNT